MLRGLQVGGCDKIRPLWRHYFQNTDGVLFFVDSNDRGRIPEVRACLQMWAVACVLEERLLVALASWQDNRQEQGYGHSHVVG